jgi:hypothetical protein
MCTRRLFNRCMAEGGVTRKAMECVCLHIFHRQDKDCSLVSSHTSIPVPQPGDKEWWASSMVRRADSNFLNLAVFGPTYLHAGARHSIPTWLYPLSSDATSFLHTYDLGCVDGLKPRPATKTVLAARPFLSPSGPIATNLTTSLTDTQV